MIKYINNWCENIIICVIIITIINLLNNSNNKYIKVVEGIFIMFVVVNPLINLMMKIENISSLINLNKNDLLQVSADSMISNSDQKSEDIVKKIYSENFEISLKEDLYKKRIYKCR